MRALLGVIGYPLAFGSSIALFLVDMYSLFLLSLKYGLLWAVAAFLFVPAQVFVPFLVGTWLIAIVLVITTFIGFALIAVKDELN